MELLKGKVAIITGAASANGIGKKTADLFIKHGAHVVITDINDEACQKAQEEIGSEHMAIAMDVSDKADCERVAEAVIKRYGKVDILVNNEPPRVYRRVDCLSQATLSDSVRLS